MTLEVNHIKGTRITWYTAISDFLDIEIKAISCKFPEVVKAGQKEDTLLFIITDKVRLHGGWKTKSQIEKAMFDMLKEQEEHILSLETNDTIRNEIGIDDFDESWFT